MFGYEADQEFSEDTLEERWIAADTPHLPDDAVAFQVLQTLSSGADMNVEDPACTSWIDSLQFLTSTDNTPDQQQTWAFTTDSLMALVYRCQRGVAVRGYVEFIDMVNLVQLVVKVDRCAFI